MSAWAAYSMLARQAQELLWGYRAIPLFLGIWGAYVLIRLPKYTGPDNNLHWLGLSTLSGVLLSLGFPGWVPWPILLAVAWVPLLILAQELPTEDKASRWRMTRHAYHTFLLWNILSTYWVTNTAFIAGIIAITANAGLMTVPFVLFRLTKRYMPKLDYLGLIVYWITFEYMHMHWELTWTWLTLGNGLAQIPALVQWYEYTGVFGGSLWILSLNLLMLWGWNHWKNGGGLAHWGLRLSLVFFVPIALSLLMYYTHTEQGVKKRIVVVQPNFEPHYEKFTVPERKQIERFLSLSNEVLDQGVEYVVYPETSFGLVPLHQVNEYRSVRRIREYFQDYPGLNIVTGVDAYRVFGSKDVPSKYVRTQIKRDGSEMQYDISNAALQITIGQDSVSVYRKSILVPGAEIFPYKDLLFFVKPIIDRLGGTVAGLATQKERSNLVSAAGVVAPTICYESIFGEYVTEYVRKGAEAIFIMTNDGWWDHTAGHRQHLYFASLRAIETRRSIARSANTGISAFINQRGDILSPTLYGEATAIRGEIYFSDRLTFYTRWGDMIARIALFTAILLLLNGFVRGRLAKEQ